VERELDYPGLKKNEEPKQDQTRSSQFLKRRQKEKLLGAVQYLCCFLNRASSGRGTAPIARFIRFDVQSGRQVAHTSSQLGSNERLFQTHTMAVAIPLMSLTSQLTAY
jgi:hypothetical protein